MTKENARTAAGVGGASRPGQGQRKHTTGRPIDEVLARLDGVVEHRDGFRAYSPFQERRKSRTLAIREAEDGRVLLHDFAGREVPEILEAIGLTVSDLFPPRPNSGTPHRSKPWRPKISPRDALEILSTEAWVIVMFGRMLVGPDPVTIEDHNRAVQALRRIETVRGWAR